jgi:hypothetical protein
MRRCSKELLENKVQLSISDFMVSFNKNMPEGFPRVSLALLKKFQAAHEMLFKNGDLWSLERHRKKLIDWLPYNINAL